MPELPEIAVLSDQMRGKVVGKAIVDVEVLQPKARQPPNATPTVVLFVGDVPFCLVLKMVQFLALRIAQATICAKFGFPACDLILLGAKLQAFEPCD